jgi:hypothetical protein
MHRRRESRNLEVRLEFRDPRLKSPVPKPEQTPNLLFYAGPTAAGAISISMAAPRVEAHAVSRYSVFWTLFVVAATASAKRGSAHTARKAALVDSGRSSMRVAMAGSFA